MQQSAPQRTSTATDAADWIARYLTRYRRQFDPHDWPTDPTDYFEFAALWVDRFTKHQITEGEANAAALQLAECPPKFRNDHLPAVVAVVQMGRRATGPAEQTVVDRLRRAHEARVRAAKEERLQAKWDALPVKRREAIRATVTAENPALLRWAHWIHQLCLARLDSPRR